MSEPLRQIWPDALLPGARAESEPTPPVCWSATRASSRPPGVGLNSALSGELLWRDFPTDYAATYFTQFWDIDWTAGGPDLDPIAGWDPAKALGEHATRVGGQGMLVLLVRGELFRRYPHTIVYAVRADTLGAQPVQRSPEFSGRIDPDLTFLGFDLGIDEARGSDGGPGWYFVLQEQPTAPRFGLDALPDQGGDGRFGPTATNWEQLHWGMLVTTAAVYAAMTYAPAMGALAGLGSLPILARPHRRGRSSRPRPGRQCRADRRGHLPAAGADRDPRRADAARGGSRPGAAGAATAA